MAEKYYTAREAGKLLNVTHQTVLKYIREGKLEAYKLGSGSNYRISDEQIQRFLNGMQQVKPGVR